MSSEKKSIVNLDLFTAVEISIEESGRDVQLFHQRVNDGYINATELCKNAGKKFNNWFRIAPTQAFLEQLSIETLISVSELVHIIKGGDYRLQGTWVHPQVAINLAQWLSPKFAVQVSKWVLDWMSGKIQKSNLPYHLERYIANMHKIPQGYFSMLNEMSTNLIAPLEKQGYTIPENMIPDISEGKMFCGWLRKEKNLEPNDFNTYDHEYSDGRIVQAKLYPNELLADFRKHFYDVWIKTRAIEYFEKRDIKSIPYIQNVILLFEGIKTEPYKMIIKEAKEIDNIKSDKFIDNIQQDSLELKNNNDFEVNLKKFAKSKKH